MPSTAQNTAKYGLWPSPITPAAVAAGTRRFGLVQGDGPWVYWTEGRPAEKGRQALLRRSPGAAEIEELLPAPWSARSRVHEYGGGEFLAAGDVVYFVNDADQDVYELRPGGTPQRLTEVPDMRFADFTLDRRQARLIAVAERHYSNGRPPDNLLVGIALAGPARGKVTPLVEGHDFFASPKVSPDGKHLAFVAWDLPDMPWDQSMVLVAQLGSGKAGRKPRRIDGGNGRASAYPRWSPDGTLVYVGDDGKTGRLMRWNGVRSRSLSPAGLEVGRPMWGLGTAPFTIDRDGTIYVAAVEPRRKPVSETRLLAVPGRSARVMHRIDAAALDSLSCCDHGLVALAASFSAPTTISCFDLAGRPQATRVRTASDATLDSNGISVPRIVYFQEGRNGARVYGLYYPPSSASHAGPPGAKPPAIVMAHGGPTSAADRSLKLRIQFFTSRGFAVFDVDYAGSTGYGRQYRERLDGEWGIADVSDCDGAALYLTTHGLADPQRIAISGGSAGGYTALMAIASEVSGFAAASSHYGISDLALLMEHTHKFESGYLHRLLGTSAGSWKKICRERSPINLTDWIRKPLILFQGLEDRVVPPEQSRLIAEKLRAEDQLVELHEFAGEGHGFRRTETIVAVLEAELAFLQKALRLR